MAGPNPWILPGNGILSGLTLGPNGPPDPWAQVVRDPWQSQMQSGVTQPRASAPDGSLPLASPIPVSYGDSTRPWPGGAPIPGPFDAWEDQYRKGMYGLWHYLFGSGSRAGTSSGDDGDYCYNRWEKEDARCGQFYPFGARYYHACKTRASDRRNLCIRNGGKPDPNEPDEYDWSDIPRDQPRP